MGGEDETWVLGTASRLEVRLRERQYRYWKWLFRAAIALNALAIVSGALVATDQWVVDLGPLGQGPGLATYPLFAAQVYAVILTLHRRRSVVLRDWPTDRKVNELAILVLTAVAAVAAVVQVVISWPRE